MRSRFNVFEIWDCVAGQAATTVLKSHSTSIFRVSLNCLTLNIKAQNSFKTIRNYPLHAKTSHLKRQQHCCEMLKSWARRQLCTIGHFVRNMVQEQSWNKNLKQLITSEPLPLPIFNSNDKDIKKDLITQSELSLKWHWVLNSTYGTVQRSQKFKLP